MNVFQRSRYSPAVDRTINGAINQLIEFCETLIRADCLFDDQLLFKSIKDIRDMVNGPLKDIGKEND